ncbi:MAG: carbohydrate porin [Verrucomicrobiota bacterium]
MLILNHNNRPSVGLVLLTLVAIATSPASAQDSEIEAEGAITESSDEISSKVKELTETRKSPFGKGPMGPLLQGWKDLWNWTNEHLNFTLGTAFTTLAQGATNGTYSGDRYGGSGDIDLFGRWYYLNRDENEGRFTEGTLGFAIEYRNRWTELPPSEIGDSLGSLWRTTRGFTDAGLRLRELWIQQSLFDSALTVRLGRINTKHLFDVYRFNSANHFYLNQAFSDNPAMAFPNNGLGGALSWDIDDNWYLIVGAADASGSTPDNDNDEIDALFTGLTSGWRGDLGALGHGRYQATLWHINEGDETLSPSASGFSLVAQQELGNGWVPFVRYARSNKPAVDTRQLATAGAVLENPFNREKDRLGLAVGWGQPHQRRFREQWVGEIFYRWAVFPELRITPSAQVILDPSKNFADDAIGVLSLRARFSF